MAFPKAYVEGYDYLEIANRRLYGVIVEPDGNDYTMIGRAKKYVYATVRKDRKVEAHPINSGHPQVVLDVQYNGARQYTIGDLSNGAVQYIGGGENAATVAQAALGEVVGSFMVAVSNTVFEVFEPDD